MTPRERGLTALALSLLAVSTLAVDDGRAAGHIAAGRQIPGQSAVYLTKALNDYRSGARKNDMMSLAPTLQDNDVEDLAAYYAAIEVTISPRR